MLRLPVFFRCINLFLLSLLTSHVALAGDSVNPNFVYLSQGQPVTGWGLALGDPSNWYSPLAGRTGTSASGKLVVSTTNFKADDDALKLEWLKRKPGRAIFNLAGNPINLSGVANSAGLVMDIKIDEMPDHEVTLGMSCGYPCQAEVPIATTLRKMQKGSWMALPIPLSCLVKAGLDPTKVSGPFMLATEGKLTISITNVHLEKLRDDEKICQ